MQPSELIELAALVSYHAPVLIRGPAMLSAAGVEQYWTASKCRLDRWGRQLKELSRYATEQAGQERNRSAAVFQRHGAVVEEILASEILTRIWAATLAGYERRHGAKDLATFGQSILLGHLEARNRVLKLLADETGSPSRESLNLNLVRRRADRWTDLLIGYLSIDDDVWEYGQSPQRAREFALDLREQRGLARSRQAWILLLTSLRTAFRSCLSGGCASSDSNSQVAAGILACFSPEIFDTAGLFPSMWMARLSTAAVDAQVLISDLFADEAPRLAPQPGFVRSQRRARE